MDVTRSNIDDALQQFSELVGSAIYCAYDLELTGIFDPVSSSTIADAPEERYNIMARAVKTYNIITLGLCLAHKQDNGEVILTPFNIYVYPKSTSPGRGPVVAMEASAIEFNAQHGMDFQTWITQGATYSNYSTQSHYEKQLRSKMSQEQQYQSNKQPSPPTFVLNYADDKTRCEELIQEFTAWYDSIGSPQPTSLGQDAQTAASSDTNNSNVEQPQENPQHAEASTQDIPIEPSSAAENNNAEDSNAEESNSNAPEAGNDDNSNTQSRSGDGEMQPTQAPLAQQGAQGGKEQATELHDDERHEWTCSASYFQARYLQQYLEHHWHRADRIIRTKFKSGTLHVFALSPEQHEEYSNRLCDEYAQDYRSSMGVTHFWNLLKQHRVPVIGQNCLFDLMFLFDAFETCQLPESLDEFRQILSTSLPEFYDNRIVYSGMQQLGIQTLPDVIPSLGNLFEAFHKDTHVKKNALIPPISVRDGYTRYTMPSYGDESTSQTDADHHKKDSNSVATIPSYHNAGYDALITCWVFCYMESTLRANGADRKQFSHYINVSNSLYAICLDPARPAFRLNKESTHQHFIAINWSPKNTLKIDEIKSALSSPPTRVDAASRTAPVYVLTYPKSGDDVDRQHAILQDGLPETTLPWVRIYPLLDYYDRVTSLLHQQRYLYRESMRLHCQPPPFSTFGQSRDDAPIFIYNSKEVLPQQEPSLLGYPWLGSLKPYLWGMLIGALTTTALLFRKF